MIALWQQFRMADLNRSRLDILSDIVVILCRRAQNFLDIRLMCALRLPAIVFGRVHTLRTLSRRKLIQYKASGTRIQRLTASSTGHDLDLTDEETAALERLLGETINADRYPLSLRILTLKAILAKIRPEPVRKPLPPLQRFEPPSKGRYRRRS
jgi:hypothetical protein